MYIRDLIEQNFGNIPTAQQREVFVMLEKFLSSTNADACFILKGYAGTGKTTLISALVKYFLK
jgi:exodeoxyribonuclease-5